MAELRRWLLGAEGARSRARGLQRRLEDIMASDEGMAPKLEAALIAAKPLPAPMFSTRLDPELVADHNPAEAFLRALRTQARARATEADLQNGMPFEVDLHPIDVEILPAAELLSRALERLRVPLAALRDRFLERLENEPELEETTRLRLEGAARSLKAPGDRPTHRLAAYSGRAPRCRCQTRRAARQYRIFAPGPRGRDRPRHRAPLAYARPHAGLYRDHRPAGARHAHLRHPARRGR